MVHAGLLARHSPLLAETFKAGAPAVRFRVVLSRPSLVLSWQSIYEDYTPVQHKI